MPMPGALLYSLRFHPSLTGRGHAHALHMLALDHARQQPVTLSAPEYVDGNISTPTAIAFSYGRDGRYGSTKDKKGSTEEAWLLLGGGRNPMPKPIPAGVIEKPEMKVSVKALTVSLSNAMKVPSQDQSQSQSQSQSHSVCSLPTTSVRLAVWASGVTTESGAQNDEHDVWLLDHSLVSRPGRIC